MHLIGSRLTGTGVIKILFQTTKNTFLEIQRLHNIRLELHALTPTRLHTYIAKKEKNV